MTAYVFIMVVILVILFILLSLLPFFGEPEETEIDELPETEAQGIGSPLIMAHRH